MVGNRNRTIICLILFAWGRQTNAAPRHFAGYMESTDSPQVQFRRLGVTSASTEFGHIIINLTSTCSTPTSDKSSDICRTGREDQEQGTTPLIQARPPPQARKQPGGTVDHGKTCWGAANTGNLIREKRFAFAIGIVAVTALLAPTAGLYATAEVEAIRRKATQIGAEQKEQIWLIEAMLNASQRPGAGG